MIKQAINSNFWCIDPLIDLYQKLQVHKSQYIYLFLLFAKDQSSFIIVNNNITIQQQMSEKAQFNNERMVFNQM